MVTKGLQIVGGVLALCFASVAWAAACDGESRLEAGTRLIVELEQTLVWETAKPGDKFKSRVVEAISVHGKVVVPRGTEVTGVLTAVRKESRLRKVAEVDVRFESMRIGGAEPIEIAAVPTSVVYRGVDADGSNPALGLLPDSKKDPAGSSIATRIFSLRGEKHLVRGTQIEIVLQKPVLVK